MLVRHLVEKVGQPREAELRVGAGGTGREHTGAARRRRVDARDPQPRLAHARLADEHEPVQPAAAVEERLDRRELRVATDQHLSQHRSTAATGIPAR
jgi:hypothetical protein